MMTERTTEDISATTYIRMMPHTAAVNIGVFFGITGRILTTSSACTSGSQGIGYAYETIRAGRQVAMLAGGGEELDATEAAVFDTLFATSTRNDAPRPRRARSTRTATGWCWARAPARWCSRSWSTPRRAARASWPRSSATAPIATAAHVTQPQAATMAVAMTAGAGGCRAGAGAHRLRQCARHGHRPWRRRRIPCHACGAGRRRAGPFAAKATSATRWARAARWRPG